MRRVIITYNIVRQNIIYNHGINGFVSVYAGGITLHGNTIIGTNGSLRGVFLYGGNNPKITLQSNIIASGHSEAAVVTDNYSFFIADSNNLLYNSSVSNIYKIGGKKYTLAQYQAISGKGQGSIQADPSFVNAANKDFHLSAWSPAVDRGINIGLTYDFDGNTRPQGLGFDMGVYESPYSQQPLPTSTNTPTATPTPTPLPAPNLLAPSNNGKALTTRPTFDWEDVIGATGYRIQISKSSTFSTKIADKTVTKSSYTPETNLPRSTLIYWRVSANGEKPSAWSTIFSFTSANPPPIPSLIAPLDNAYFSNYTPKLDWNDPINTDHYQVQIASSNSFSSSSLIFDATTQPPYSSFIPPSPLTPNRTYYWRVRAFGATGEYSLWSSVRHFHTRLPAPVLLYPVNEGKAPAISTFDWEDVPEATGYGIQVSTSSSFSTFVVNRTVLDSSYSYSLKVGKKYYWRVRTLGTYTSVRSKANWFITE